MDVLTAVGGDLAGRFLVALESGMGRSGIGPAEERNSPSGSCFSRSNGETGDSPRGSRLSRGRAAGQTAGSDCTRRGGGTRRLRGGRARAEWSGGLGEVRSGRSAL